MKTIGCISVVEFYQCPLCITLAQIWLLQICLNFFFLNPLRAMFTSCTIRHHLCKAQCDLYYWPEIPVIIWMIACSFVKAIEDEGGDPDNIEITASVDTPTRKHSKSKGKTPLSELFLSHVFFLIKLTELLYCTSAGKKTDLEADTIMEEESFSKVWRGIIAMCWFHWNWTNGRSRC